MVRGLQPRRLASLGAVIKTAAVTVLVTGSSGHLGDALMRTFAAEGRTARGFDLRPAPQTDVVASLVDRDAVRAAMRGVRSVLHTAALHKPHVATHSKQAFVDTNISGTLVLLEEAVRAGVDAFIFTSTTSAFGDALHPAPDDPAVWITESIAPLAKNIYGTSKVAAEDLCRLFHRNEGLACLILRTSRFFPEADDNRRRRDAFDDANLKLNELLYRRADIEDMVSAHVCALGAAKHIGFGRYIISATTPFSKDDCRKLRVDPASVVTRYVPEFPPVFKRLSWQMLDDIDRVYANDAARRDLGWAPIHSFHSALARVAQGGDVLSPLARAVGTKGYHDEVFDDGPYPV